MHVKCTSTPAGTRGQGVRRDTLPYVRVRFLLPRRSSSESEPEEEDESEEEEEESRRLDRLLDFFLLDLLECLLWEEELFFLEEVLRW